MDTQEHDMLDDDSVELLAEASEIIRSAKKWIIVLSVAAVLSWVLSGAVLILTSHARIETADARGYPPADSYRTNSGPWGRLEHLPVVIAPPLENVSENIEDFSASAVWRFPNVGPAELPVLFESISLSDSLRTKLLSMAQIDISLRGMVIRPSREFVLGLSRIDRGKLYTALCGYMENGDQQKQFVFRGTSPEQWFTGSGVSPDTRKLVEPLIYRHRGFMYFADLRSIAETVNPPSQLPRLVRALSRDATVLVHLKLDKNDNIDALVKYWGCGGREQQVRPILESLVRNGVEREINIVHLLPPLARRKLYTYSPRLDAETRPKRDCNWTAANFFNETPDDRFCDPKEVVKMLRNDYRRVHSSLQLGDIAVVLDEKKMSVHSAVYVADEIYFHKCGPGASAPWTLAREKDLASYYPRTKQGSIWFYRRKDL
ncbi:MAG: hypothetical protein QGG42_01480 [Phycisphaerae bacterium]|jgi:hypothetical protein|nr:hypothetical protein [Phycisphaerae bacterium]